MRVLHLTSEYPPQIWGGLGTAVGGLTVASAQSGIATDVLLVGHMSDASYGQAVAMRPVGERDRVVAESPNVTVFQVPHATAVEEALRLARERRPDVIHIHPVELWPIARAIQNQLGTPIVYTVHSLNLAEYEVGQEPPAILTLWNIQRELLGSANRIITLTQDEKELLVAACPEVYSRVEVVGNGIADCDQARLSSFAERRRESPTVLYTGRFVERKGLRELFAAMPMVLEQAPTTRFVLVGGYGSAEDVARAWLPPALSSYRDQIHFTGWLRPAEVAPWYALADILVVPSWYEPFGMVVLEGMLYGLPIVASDVGGPREILKNGRTGLLFPPKDSGALAETLLALVKDPGLRHRLGKAAAAEVRQKWMWPHIVEKMQAVYRNAINTV